MISSFEKRSLLAEIDEFGEDEIRLRAKGIWYDIEQKRFLQAEFERRDRELAERDRLAQLQASSIATAQSRIANVIAGIALLVAIIALLKP